MMMLGRLHAEEESDQDANTVTGEIYTYYNLDSDSPWFNIERNEEAVESELKGVSIPGNLKPHLSKFMFAFLTDTHRMCIQLKSGKRTLSIATASAAFKKLFALEELSDYAPIEVTVEPSRETVEEILKMPSLHRLHIELVRPNPDDGHELELALLDRLQKQSAVKMTQELVSQKDHSLHPDAATKDLARVAASNGYVEGSGKDINNNSVMISTRNTPLIEKPIFDPREGSLKDFMIYQARKITAFFDRSNG